MKNSDIFLEKFNEIEDYLKKHKTEKSFNGFTHLLKIQARKDKTLALFQEDLREFAQLRNAIVHNKRHNNEVIAEPAQFVVEEISKIAELLTNPPKVADQFIKEVAVLYASDSLEKAIKMMSEKSYSQIPIYLDENFLDVLSTNTIVRLLGKNHDLDLTSYKIANSFEYKNENEYCEFVSADSNLFEIIEIFENEQKYRDRKKVEAVLITKSGTGDQLPIGIITHTDLPKVYQALNL